MLKRVSRLVLAAALSFGLAGVPLVAKEKPAAPAVAKGPELSKEFRVAAQTVQKALQAKDFAAAAAGLPAVDAASTLPGDKYYAALFRYQIAANAKDEAAMSAAVAAMLASGAAPVEQQGALNAQVGRDAYFARNYDKAIASLTEALRLGQKQPDIFIVLADSNFKKGQYPAGLAFVDQGITAQKASGQPVTEDWYRRAVDAAYKSKVPAEELKWSSAWLRDYPTAQNWRDTLILYRNSQKLDPQVALDLYRLMRVNKSIAGESDYYDYAAIASERGLPGEAKAVVDEGLASGKLPAGSRNLTEIRTAATPKIAADRASLPASERAAAGAATGKTAMSTADAYLGYGDDAKAAALYRLALQKGGVDADAASMRMGIALARSGDKDGARAAFTAVKGVRTDLAALWLLYLDAPAKAA